jgi:Protein of unknown function (DUF1549)/Protein of unknown function (DUF1553)
MKLDPNDPKVTAYALGELSGEERASIEAELAGSADARQEVERVREVAALLTQELKKEPLGALSQLQRIAIESETHRMRQPRRRGVPWMGLIVAASLLLATGLYFLRPKSPDVDLAQGGGAGSTAPDQSKQTAPVKVARTDKNIKKANGKENMPNDSDEAMNPPESEMDQDKLAADSVPDPSTPEEPIDPEPAKKAVSRGPVAFRANKTKITVADDVSWINDRVTKLWAENNVKPSSPASDGEFIRRAYLDIVGTVPPAEDAAEFIKSREKDKKAKLIMSLVNSEDYTKYWSSVWSNLLVGRRPDRNRNVDKEALEKYLRDCFAENRPWTQMTYELVTASGGSTKASLKEGVPFNGATNFLLAHMNDGNVPATAFTTRLFLGVQVQCTQCHDHPFNDRTQEAFWGINAFFQKMRRQDHNDVDDTGRQRFLYTELSERPVNSGEDLFVRYDKRSALVAVTPPRLLDGQIVEPAERELRLRDELGWYIIRPDNEYFAQAIVNRMWAHFLGRGIVHPADDLGTHNPASNPDLLTRLAKNFEESNYDLKRLITWVTLSLPYSLSSVMNSSNKEDDQYFSHYPLKQMTPEQFFDSLIVASKANRVGAKGGWEAADKMKTDLQQQFTTVFNNDENTEADSFNGTIPQALMLMNGGLIQKAISKEPGSYLHERVQEIMKKKARGADIALLNDLYLAALARYPSNKEKQLAQVLLNDTMAKSKDKNPLDAYQDIFWALLNSSEFVLNH